MKISYPIRSILFFLGEGCLIFLTINLIYLIFIDWRIQPEEIWLDITRTLIVTFIFQLSLYFFDLYHHDLISSPAEILSRMIQAFGFGCIFLAGLYFLLPSLIISTKIFWTFYFTICLILFGWRTLYNFVLQKKLFTSPIIILGTGKISSAIASLIAKKHDSDYKIAAFIGPEKPAFDSHDIPVINKPDSILDLAKKYQVNTIVVAIDDRRLNMPIKELMECKFNGISIKDGTTFFESISGRISVENVNPTWFIFAEGFKIQRLSSLIKRLLDITLSIAGLLLTLPISLITAICIKLESPGPILYCQERTGEGGNTFRMLKLRSMYENSEENGAVWACENDARISKTGKFIRKLRIDEIPQMWNVLKGDMSFVGPRPERPEFVKELTQKIPYYSLRHTIKPGITGLAQIRYGYGASEEDALRKLEYDLYYMKNISVIFDLLIIFITIKIVLFQKGSR